MEEKTIEGITLEGEAMEEKFMEEKSMEEKAMEEKVMEESEKEETYAIKDGGVELEINGEKKWYSIDEINAITAEYARLIFEELPRINKELAEARKLGDLSVNTEYVRIKDEQIAVYEEIFRLKEFANAFMKKEAWKDIDKKLDKKEAENAAKSTEAADTNN